MLEMYVQCSKSVPETDIRLLTPGGVVDSYGTFVLIVPEHQDAVLFHTTDPDLDKFKIRFQAIKYLDDLDWISGPTIAPISPKFDKIMEETIIDLGLDDYKPRYSDNLAISMEDALKFTVDIPKGLVLRPVKVEEAKIMDDLWHYRGPKTLKYIEAVIRTRGGIVLCNKDSGEWLSWCLYSFVGGVGMMKTAKGHRGKGYGEIIAKMMTKRVAENGVVPQVQIQVGLDASRQLFERIGYKFTYRLHWHYVSRSKTVKTLGCAR